MCTYTLLHTYLWRARTHVRTEWNANYAQITSVLNCNQQLKNFPPLFVLFASSLPLPSFPPYLIRSLPSLWSPSLFPSLLAYLLTFSLTYGHFLECYHNCRTLTPVFLTHYARLALSDPKKLWVPVTAQDTPLPPFSATQSKECSFLMEGEKSSFLHHCQPPLPYHTFSVILILILILIHILTINLFSYLFDSLKCYISTPSSPLSTYHACISSYFHYLHYLSTFK